MTYNVGCKANVTSVYTANNIIEKKERDRYPAKYYNMLLYQKHYNVAV